MKKGFILLTVFSVATLCFFNDSLVLADEEEKLPLRVKMDSRYLSESDVASQFGNIQITESKLEVEYDLKAFGQLPLTFSLEGKHIDIDEDLAQELPSHLEGRSLGLSVKFPVPFIDTEHYYLGLDVMPSLYTDKAQWESSAFRVPFRTYLIYKQSDQLIWVAGVTVRIDYDDEVMPLIGVIYKPTDRLSFNLASTDPYIEYKLTEQTAAFWEFGYVMDEYEVNRDGQKGVVLKYREASTGLGLRHKISQNF